MERIFEFALTQTKKTNKLAVQPHELVHSTRLNDNTTGRQFRQHISAASGRDSVIIVDVWASFRHKITTNMHMRIVVWLLKQQTDLAKQLEWSSSTLNGVSQLPVELPIPGDRLALLVEYKKNINEIIARRLELVTCWAFLVYEN